MELSDVIARVAEDVRLSGFDKSPRIYHRHRGAAKVIENIAETEVAMQDPGILLARRPDDVGHLLDQGRGRWQRAAVQGPGMSGIDAGILGEAAESFLGFSAIKRVEPALLHLDRLVCAHLGKHIGAACKDLPPHVRRHRAEYIEIAERTEIFVTQIVAGPVLVGTRAPKISRDVTSQQEASASIFSACALVLQTVCRAIARLLNARSVVSRRREA